MAYFLLLVDNFPLIHNIGVGLTLFNCSSLLSIRHGPKLSLSTHRLLFQADTVLYPARYRWGTYHGCCSRRDGARTSVKMGSWASLTHLQ